jgi:hypothetical protein
MHTAYHQRSQLRLDVGNPRRIPGLLALAQVAVEVRIGTKAGAGDVFDDSREPRHGPMPVREVWQRS